MGNLILWLLTHSAKSPRVALVSRQASHSKSNAGFTAIELLIALLMVGILSAIAAPGWLAFTNRQRLNKANDAVLGALQDAQRQAKSKKLSYCVSFKSDQGKVPQFAIYPATQTVCSISASDTRWTNLGQDIALKPGQVILYTNINGQNQASASTYSNGTISFNYMGALDLTLDTTTQNTYLGNTGLIVTVAAPQSVNSTQPIAGTKRCVMVKTLLGGMQTAKDPNCN